MVTSNTTRLSGVAGALAIKAPVRVATTANITLSGIQTIDGVAVVADDRVLVKNQTTGSENGIYKASSGDWTRTVDVNGNRDVVTGTRVLVVAGDTQAVSEWRISTTGTITIDTTSITFAATSPLVSLATFGNGTVSLPGLTPATDTDSGLYRIGANNIGLALAGAKVLDASTTGLGVTGTLTVSGNVTCSATLTVTTTSTFTGVATFSSTSHLQLPGGATGSRPGSPAAQNLRFNTTTGFMEYYDGSAWIECIKWHNPRGWIDGLVMSNGTDALHDLNIAAGTCRDSTDAIDIDVSAITKTFDEGNGWVTGTGNDGLSSSLTLSNSTWYHVFAILVGGVADIGADTSLSAANLVADHTVTNYRRIGSFLTDGSANILAFSQLGDEFLWSDPPLDVNVSDLGTTAVLYALSTPSDLKLNAIINTWYNKTSGNLCYISSPDVTDEAPSTSAAPLYTVNDPTGSAPNLPVRTDTSSQIRARANNAASTFKVSTLGWIDPRGRNA